MIEYELRLTTDNEEFVREVCSKYSADTYVYAFESPPTKRPHFHVYLQMSKGAEALRRHLRQQGFKGNTGYKMSKVRDSLKYLAYVIKDGNYTVHGVLPHSLDDIKSYDLSIKNAKKSTRQSALQNLVDVIDELVVKLDDYYVLKSNGEIFTEKWIVDQIVSYYASQGTLIREFFLVSLAQTLSLKYVASYERRLSHRILDRM